MPVVVTQSLSATIDGEVSADGDAEGQALIVSVLRQGEVSSENLFGRRSRSDTESSMRVTVGRVVPSSGVGLFSIARDQTLPRNLFVSLDWLQARLGREARANSLLLTGGDPASRAGVEITVLAIGWLLGGDVGVGTLLFAGLIGPLVHITLPLFDTRRTAKTAATPAEAAAEA